MSQLFIVVRRSVLRSVTLQAEGGYILISKGQFIFLRLRKREELASEIGELPLFLLDPQLLRYSGRRNRNLDRRHV